MGVAIRVPAVERGGHGAGATSGTALGVRRSCARSARCGRDLTTLVAGGERPPRSREPTRPTPASAIPRKPAKPGGATRRGRRRNGPSDAHRAHFSAARGLCSPLACPSRGCKCVSSRHLGPFSPSLRPPQDFRIGAWRGSCDVSASNVDPKHRSDAKGSRLTVDVAAWARRTTSSEEGERVPHATSTTTSPDAFDGIDEHRVGGSGRSHVDVDAVVDDPLPWTPAGAGAGTSVHAAAAAPLDPGSERRRLLEALEAEGAAAARARADAAASREAARDADARAAAAEAAAREAEDRVAASQARTAEVGVRERAAAAEAARQRARAEAAAQQTRLAAEELARVRAAEAARARLEEEESRLEASVAELRRKVDRECSSLRREALAARGVAARRAEEADAWQARARAAEADARRANAAEAEARKAAAMSRAEAERLATVLEKLRSIIASYRPIGLR